jgi:hypothetical protein
MNADQQHGPFPFYSSIINQHSSMLFIFVVSSDRRNCWFSPHRPPRAQG